MAWNYSHHNTLRKCLYWPSRVIKFLLGLSWLYAHYRNGTFPYLYPDRPRLFFRNRKFLDNVKSEWRNSAESD